MKVKHETIANIAKMGQKEALRKHAAGEGDEEFNEAIKRYYSERRIKAAQNALGSSKPKISNPPTAKPGSEVLGTREEAPVSKVSAAQKKQHAAAAERRLQGMASSKKGGVSKEAVAKKKTGAIMITAANRAAEAKRRKEAGKKFTIASMAKK